MALRFVYQISCNLNKTVTAKTIQHANHFRSMSPCFQHVQGFKKVTPNHCRSQPLLCQSCQKSVNPATQDPPNSTAKFSNYHDNKYDEEYEHKPQKVYISNPYSKPRRAKRFPLKERLNRIASYCKQQMKETSEQNEVSAAVEECPKLEKLRDEDISIPPTLSKLNLHSRYKRKKYYLEDSVPQEEKRNNDTDVYEKLAKRAIKREKKVIPHLQPSNMKPYGSSKTMFSPRAYYTKRSSSKISFKAIRKQRFKKFEPTTAPYNFDNEKFIKRKKSLPKMSWNREYSTSSKPDEITIKSEGFLKRTASFIKNLVQKKSPSVTEVKQEVVTDEKIEVKEPVKSEDWERCDRIISLYKELNPTQQLVKKTYPSGSAEEKRAVQEAMDFVAKCTRNYQLERFGNSKSKESIFLENTKHESKTEQPSVAKSSVNLETPSFVIAKKSPPILSYSDVLKQTKPKSKTLVIYPNNNSNKNLYSTFYARNFSTSSQNSKVLMKIPHRVRGFKTSSKCLKVQVSNRNRNYSTFTKNFFPKSETKLQSRFKSSKKNKKHPFCGVTPFDPPPNNVDPCLPQDCVYVKKPKPLDWKLKRLRKRCQPMELDRKCPQKKKPCADRADASLTIEKKKLPKICPAEDCPCSHELLKEGCPLPRLKPGKIEDPPRKAKCRPINPCPPRADAKLKTKQKRLPRLMVHKIGKTEGNYPEVKLKRICKEKVKERKRVCPVPKTCESQPRADDGMEIEMLTLRPFGPCKCKKIRPEPLRDVRMRRLKKITIEPPPRVCPPVSECDEMVTKSDVACGYTVKERTLQPMVLKSAYNYINIHYYANKKKCDGEKKYHTLASSSTNDRLPKGRTYSTAAILNSSNFQEEQFKKKEKRLKKKLLSNLVISLANFNIARSFPKPKTAPANLPRSGNASWNYLASCLNNRKNIKPDHTLSPGMCQKLLEDLPLTPKSSVNSENFAKIQKGTGAKRTRVLGYSKLSRRELSTSPIICKNKGDSKKCPTQQLKNCDKRSRQTCQNVYKFKKYVKQEPPYPSYSECGLTFDFPKCECPANQKHLQPQYKLIPKIKVLKPPPPESDIIDIRKVKNCVLKKLDKVNEGETKTCENYKDPYKEFDGLKQLNSKMAAELKQDRNRRIPLSGKAGTKCGCPMAVLSLCEKKKSGSRAPRATDGCGKNSSKGSAPRAIGSCKSDKSKAPRAKIDCNKDKKPDKPKCGKDK